MPSIKLLDGSTAIVDDDDFDLVAARKWRIAKRKNGDVAAVVSGGSGAVVLIHRLICGAARGQVVDHVNGDPLDNRRANLRFCSHAENMRNRKRHANNKVGMKGVYFDARRKKFRAAIRFNGSKIELGSFDTADLAHAAYAGAAARFHGNFSRVA